MREQLIKYVDLLFAGAQDAEDIRQEILQNTLDRYDDLVSQGKTPEAAYRLAISGIGDIGEILGSIPVQQDATAQEFPPKNTNHTPSGRRVLRVIAVALYILCPIPLFVLSELGLEILGLCGTIAIVAIATALIMLSPAGTDTHAQRKEVEPDSPETRLRKNISSAIGTGGLVIYLVLSFATGAWLITWLIFPIMGAVKGIVNAVMDLKEASQHEN